MPNREVAAKQGISEGTVKSYLHHIYNKPQVSSGLIGLHSMPMGQACATRLPAVFRGKARGI